MPANQTRIDELRATGKLPSPNGVALRIMELAQQDDVSIADFADVLKADPALTGKVLRVVNSARTGLAKPTADLPHAVSLLGLVSVRRLVLSFSVVSSSPRGICDGFDFDDFWRRSLATALASQSMCGVASIAPPEEVYCFGLLSQVGRLALAAVHPQRYSNLLREVSDANQLLSAEQRAFGIDHNELTSALFSDWGLPEYAAEAMVNQENPTSDDIDLAHVLNFSAGMVNMWFAPPQQRRSSVLDLLQLGQRFDFATDTVTKIANQAMSEWSEWCSLLEIDETSVVSLDTAIEELQEIEDCPISSTSDTALRILVVDDDAVCLRFVESHLSKMGHHLHTAPTGQEALRALLEFNPQIVLTDWRMPEMDGLQLCRTIRQTDIGRSLYLIMVTGQDDKTCLTEAFAAGCDDYITKPVHPQELCARIRAAARVIRLQTELARENSEAQQYVAELSIGNRQLQREAWTDALTGLPNRRFGLARLAESWDASVRLGYDLACILLDVDHFKGVNDTYGHPIGDRVLQETATILQRLIRRSDVVCRFGGEEFLAICPGMDLRDAECTAERLRAAVEDHRIVAEPFIGSVTISAGVATWHESMEGVECMIKAVDDALYAAKRAGRNRVHTAAPCTAAVNDGLPAPCTRDIPTPPLQTN